MDGNYLAVLGEPSAMFVLFNDFWTVPERRPPPERACRPGMGPRRCRPAPDGGRASRAGWVEGGRPSAGVAAWGLAGRPGGARLSRASSPAGPSGGPVAEEGAGRN
ncbi:hypothetical protein GCM10017673_08640 [Streptosporangium violaceochromogenes]|nr:hypothetical protein GCM10017673_08640 [Streptosporangium violaceochromogenes]